MSTVQESSNDQTINLCSLGEELLASFIKKGRDSVISKNEINTDSLENENEYPDFFKMLNTDASKCDEKWIVDFNQATNNASEEEIKKYGKQAIDMLSSIIYFLITQNKTEKKKKIVKRIIIKMIFQMIRIAQNTIQKIIIITMKTLKMMKY